MLFPCIPLCSTKTSLKDYKMTQPPHSNRASCNDIVYQQACILASLKQQGLAPTNEQLEHWKEACKACDSKLDQRKILALLHNECLKRKSSCFISAEKINIFGLGQIEAESLLDYCFHCQALTSLKQGK